MQGFQRDLKNPIQKIFINMAVEPHIVFSWTERAGNEIIKKSCNSLKANIKKKMMMLTNSETHAKWVSEYFQSRRS